MIAPVRVRRAGHVAHRGGRRVSVRVGACRRNDQRCAYFIATYRDSISSIFASTVSLSFLR